MERLIIKAQFDSLLPTIQPAGFKDVGAGTYRNPKTGELSVVVHSPQATANSLEAATWDALKNQPVEALSGLPYVEILDQNNTYRASTHTLPHRLASGYLLKHKDAKPFTTQLKADFKSLGEPATVFKYCPNSLLHGVFFSHLGDGRIKMARAISASVTAHGCERVTTGGASHDPIVPSGKQLDLSTFEGSAKGSAFEGSAKAKGSALGIGNLPYYQEAFAPKQIEGIFIVDLAQIASLGLPKVATDLLTTLAEYKIARLLSRPWRVRSGCDLDVPQTNTPVRSPEKIELELKKLIADCSQYFADPAKTAIQLTLKA